jgi:hypothetical protein
MTGFDTVSRLNSVAMTANGLRAGVYVQFGSNNPPQVVQERLVMYDGVGVPVDAWRTRAAPYCAVSPLLLTPAYAWVGTNQISSAGGIYPTWIVGDYASIAGIEQSIDLKDSAVGAVASDVALAFLAGSNGLYVYGRAKQTSALFPGGAGWGFNILHVQGVCVIAMRDACASNCQNNPPNFLQWEADLWTSQSQKVVTLLQPSGASVPEANTDGTTLVWFQVPPNYDAQGWYPAGDLWTSPMATSAAALQPTLRRPAPLMGSSGTASKANAGYYAVLADKPWTMHVYRLSDMQHWSFGSQEQGSIRGPEYVDANEVWFSDGLGIYRQSLSALGPGDAPP